MKMLSWHVASWWPVAQRPHTDLGLVTLQCGRPGWIDAGWCGVAGPREAQGCRVSVDRTCPVAGLALVPAAIVEQDWLVSCAVMGVPGAQVLCTLMQLWACLQLISAIESIPVSFCSSKQRGLCAGDPLWTPMLGMIAESYCCVTGCVLPHLLTPLCFCRTRMEPCHPQSCRTSSVSSPVCPGAPSSTTRYAPLIKACFPCMDSSASGRKLSPSPSPLVTSLSPC